MTFEEVEKALEDLLPRFCDEIDELDSVFVLPDAGNWMDMVRSKINCKAEWLYYPRDRRCVVEGLPKNDRDLLLIQDSIENETFKEAVNYFFDLGYGMEKMYGLIVRGKLDGERQYGKTILASAERILDIEI
jgi:hypothetical protein